MGNRRGTLFYSSLVALLFLTVVALFKFVSQYGSFGYLSRPQVLQKFSNYYSGVARVANPLVVHSSDPYIDLWARYESDAFPYCGMGVRPKEGLDNILSEWSTKFDYFGMVTPGDVNCTFYWPENVTGPNYFDPQWKFFKAQMEDEPMNKDWDITMDFSDHRITQFRPPFGRHNFAMVRCNVTKKAPTDSNEQWKIKYMALNPDVSESVVDNIMLTGLITTQLFVHYEGVHKTSSCRRCSPDLDNPNQHAYAPPTHWNLIDAAKVKPEYKDIQELYNDEVFVPVTPIHTNRWPVIIIQLPGMTNDMLKNDFIQLGSVLKDNFHFFDKMISMGGSKMNDAISLLTGWKEFYDVCQIPQMNWKTSYMEWSDLYSDNPGLITNGKAAGYLTTMFTDDVGYRDPVPGVGRGVNADNNGLYLAELLKIMDRDVMRKSGSIFYSQTIAHHFMNTLYDNRGVASLSILELGSNCPYSRMACNESVSVLSEIIKDILLDFSENYNIIITATGSSWLSDTPLAQRSAPFAAVRLADSFYKRYPNIKPYLDHNAKLATIGHSDLYELTRDFLSRRFPRPDLLELSKLTSQPSKIQFPNPFGVFGEIYTCGDDVCKHAMGKDQYFCDYYQWSDDEVAKVSSENEVAMVGDTLNDHTGTCELPAKKRGILLGASMNLMERPLTEDEVLEIRNRFDEYLWSMESNNGKGLGESWTHDELVVPLNLDEKQKNPHKDFLRGVFKRRLKEEAGIPDSARGDLLLDAWMDQAGIPGKVDEDKGQVKPVEEHFEFPAKEAAVKMEDVLVNDKERENPDVEGEMRAAGKEKAPINVKKDTKILDTNKGKDTNKTGGLLGWCEKALEPGGSLEPYMHSLYAGFKTYDYHAYGRQGISLLVPIDSKRDCQHLGLRGEECIYGDVWNASVADIPVACGDAIPRLNTYLAGLIKESFEDNYCDHKIISISAVSEHKTMSKLYQLSVETTTGGMFDIVADCVSTKTKPLAVVRRTDDKIIQNIGSYQSSIIPILCVLI